MKRNASKFTAAVLILLLLAAQLPAAVLYVRFSDGDDSSDGSTWALAKKTLAGAFTAASAGDTIYVSDAHAETQASVMTLTSPGTAASPVRVICVDDAAEPPTAKATTGTISTTGANGIVFGAQHTYFYGITFNCGTGGSAAHILSQNLAERAVIFDTCQLALVNTNAGSVILWGDNTNVDEQFFAFINTSFSFAASGQTLRHDSGRILWRDTADAVQGTAPSKLFTATTANPGSTTTIRGVDLSAVTGALFSVVGSQAEHYQLSNCKLGEGVAIASDSPSALGGSVITLINCDSGDTNYHYHHQNYQGKITQEDVIVKTGGASDGTTPISREMVTTANSKIYSPLVDLPIVVWCDSLTEQTVTIDVVTDNVTLTDAEAWIDVEYLGTSGFPLSVTVSDRVTDDVFGTPANQTADANSTWTTTGLTTPVEQELSVTFTPAEKGWFRVYVNLAKASTTMYYDPRATNASGRQWMVGAGGYVNEGPAGMSRSRALNQ